MYRYFTLLLLYKDLLIYFWFIFMMTKVPDVANKENMFNRLAVL